MRDKSVEGFWLRVERPDGGEPRITPIHTDSDGEREAGCGRDSFDLFDPIDP